MSHVSAALQALTRGRRQQDIADAIGMPRPTFTQLRLGMHPPSVAVMEQLLRAFNEQEQRALVKAYLDDETPAAWFGRVQIAFAEKPGKKQKPPARAAAGDPQPEAAPAADGGGDKELSTAIATLLASAKTSPDVRQVILDLAMIV